MHLGGLPRAHQGVTLMLPCHPGAGGSGLVCDKATLSLCAGGPSSPWVSVQELELLCKMSTSKECVKTVFLEDWQKLRLGFGPGCQVCWFGSCQ